MGTVTGKVLSVNVEGVRQSDYEGRQTGNVLANYRRK